MNTGGGKLSWVENVKNADIQFPMMISFVLTVVLFGKIFRKNMPFPQQKRYLTSDTGEPN
jgi:hypothetical protein